MTKTPRNTLPRTCIFCGRGHPQVKITKEHVLPTWLKASLSNPETLRSRKRQIYIDQAGEPRQVERIIERKSPYDSTVNDVCNECNNDWLTKKIEAPVQDFLIDIALGKNVTLTADQSKSLALWASKTAAIRALEDKGLAITTEHYRYIRDKLEPPPHTIIFAAYVAPPFDTFSRHLQFSESTNDGINFAHCSTIILCNLMLCVIGFSTKPRIADTEKILTHLQAMACGHLIELWPNHEAFVWPLNFQLTSYTAYAISEEVPIFFSRLTEQYLIVWRGIHQR